MTRCDLQNPGARKTVCRVWRHLRARFPDDARVLAAIVKQIVPLTDAVVDEGASRGSMGGFSLIEEELAFYARVSEEHGQGYGTMKLPDADELTAGEVAHEMGHAFASCEDLITRDAPMGEWASQAVADMHAVRWGLLTLEEIRQRHARNVAALEPGEVNLQTAYMHHGPPPGGDWIELGDQRWRLREDFIFELMDRS